MADDVKSLPALKDWRDIASYPSLARFSARWREAWGVAAGRPLPDAAVIPLWRWEFLRRRDDYRRAFAEQHARSQIFYDSIKMEPDNRADLVQFGSPHLSELASRFGLNHVPAPEWDYRVISPPLFLRTYGFSTPANGPSKLSDYQALIVFDMTLPITPQLDSAKRYVEASQTQMYGKAVAAPRRHRAKWLTYLRVLDAHAAGETFATIWLEIGRGERLNLNPNTDDQDQAGARGYELLRQAQNVQTQLTELAHIKNSEGS